MKQFITGDQWKEIEFKQQRIFEAHVESRQFGFGEECRNESDYFPSIGQMIEFLGEDFKGIDVVDKKDEESYSRMLQIRKGKLDRWYIVKIKHMEIQGVINICDVLWEACKYKLNK